MPDAQPAVCARRLSNDSHLQTRRIQLNLRFAPTHDKQHPASSGVGPGTMQHLRFAMAVVFAAGAAGEAKPTSAI